MRRGIHLADVAGGGGVGAALRGGLPQDPDVAVLAEGGAPAVPHQPVVHDARRAEVGAVAHQLHRVVVPDVLVVWAAREHSAVVVFEGARIDRDGKRADLGVNHNVRRHRNTAYISNVVHDSVLVVGRQVVVASDGGHGLDCVQVVGAVLAVCGGPRHVGVVGFRHLGIGQDNGRTCPKSWT